MRTGNRGSALATAAPVEDVAADLANQRALAAAHRADELARVRAEAVHTRNRADVVEDAQRAELDRAERVASARSAAKLARLYREARDAGERTRVAAHLARSGEARALRLERLRVLNLRVLVPVLLGFAAWSTTGVQQGAARLMRVDQSDLTWFALWVLEPVLIGAVVWVIIARARLASSGGRLDDRAIWTAAGCLMTSVVLNMAAAAWPSTWTTSTVAALLASMLAHVIGPAGAAATAHLIGIIDESIGDADPWRDEHGEPVPLLADLHLDEASLFVAERRAEVVEEPLEVEQTDQSRPTIADLVRSLVVLRPLPDQVADEPPADARQDPPQRAEDDHGSDHQNGDAPAGQEPVTDLESAIRSASANSVSQREIARRFGISRDRVRKILDGSPDPGPELVSATTNGHSHN
jgi:hypothetical protein